MRLPLCSVFIVSDCGFAYFEFCQWVLKGFFIWLNSTIFSFGFLVSCNTLESLLHSSTNRVLNLYIDFSRVFRLSIFYIFILPPVELSPVKHEGYFYFNMRWKQTRRFRNLRNLFKVTSSCVVGLRVKPRAIWIQSWRSLRGPAVQYDPWDCREDWWKSSEAHLCTVGVVARVE